MTVELNYDELVLLIQLVSERFTDIQRKDPEATTPFEAALFKKLCGAQTDEMKSMKQRGVLCEEKGRSCQNLVVILGNLCRWLT